MILFIFVNLLFVSIRDVLHGEISDGLVASFVLAASIDVLNHPSADFTSNLISGLTIALVLWMLGEVYFRKFNEEGLGIGDAKLIGASVFFLGPASIPSLLFLSSLGGIIAILTMQVLSSEATKGIPFAPFISYAVIVIYFFGPIPF